MQIAHLFHQRASQLTAAFALLAGATSVFGAIAVGPKDNIYIGGFVSQGFMYTDGNNYPFDASNGSFDFRELGVNISTTFGSHFRVGAQAFAQDFGPYGQNKPLLDWAVADYNFRQEFGVRVGRIKYPKGLYGEVLDLDALRPFVMLPLGMYNPIVRDFSSAFDGGMVYGNIGLGQAGSVDYKVFYGDIRMDTDQGVADYFLNTSIYNKSKGLNQLGMDSVSGVSFDWATPVSGLKVHASYSTFKNLDVSGEFAGVPFVLPVDLVLVDYNYWTFGAEYMWNDWTFASEWQTREGSTELRLPIAPTTHGDAKAASYYFMASRRLGERWELGTYWSIDTNPGAAAGTSPDMKRGDDIALAVRYNYNEHLLFKLEWHNVEGLINIFDTPRVSNPLANQKSSSQFLAAKTTYSF